MIYNKQEIYEALNEILPAWYEQVVDELELPCITYVESSNVDDNLTCETMGYSIQYYTIKLWGEDINELSQYATKVDKVMRSLGYKRTSANEVIGDSLICKQLIYKGLGFENNFGG